MKTGIITNLLIAVILSLSGCSTAPQRSGANNSEYDRISARTALRQVTIGMGEANVAAVLGPPNLVTEGDGGDKTWIYDKVSNEVKYALDRGAIIGLVFGATASAVVNTNGGPYSSSAWQETLTVAIKFDQDANVRDFSYSTSKFRTPIVNASARCHTGTRDLSNYCDRWSRYALLDTSNNADRQP